MSCERYLEVLSASIDGAARPEEEVELDRHLGSCAGCRRAKAEYASISGAALAATSASMAARPGPAVWDAIEKHATAGLRAQPKYAERELQAQIKGQIAAAVIVVAGLVGAFALGRATATLPTAQKQPEPQMTAREAEERAVEVIADAFFGDMAVDADLGARIRELERKRSN